MTINPNAPTLSQLIREHGYTYTIDSIESIPHYHLVPVSEVCFGFKKDHPAADCHGCEWCFPWVFCDAEHFIRDLIRPNSTLRNTVLQQFMVFVAQVFEHCRENFDPSDLIQVHCTAATLDKGPLTMPLTRADQLDSGANHLFLAMQKVLQSDGVSVTDGSFMLTLYHVESARFGGYDRVRLAKCFTARMLGYHVQNRSYIEIPDGIKPYRAAAALLVAKNYCQTRRRRTLLRFVRRLRNSAAVIFQQCKLSSSEAYVTPEGVDLKGLRKLCNHPDFCDYPVIIFDDSRSNQVVFKANTKFASHGDVLYLHYVAGHLNVITNVNAMMGKKGTFCRFCCKFLNGNYTHKCDFEICKQCKTYCDCSDNVAMSAESHVCDSCHRSFRSQQCFQNHLTVGMTPLYGKKFCVCESTGQF